MITHFGMNWDIQRLRVEVLCFHGDKVIGTAKTAKQLSGLIGKYGAVDGIAQTRPMWRGMYRKELVKAFDDLVRDGMGYIS